MAKDLKPGDRFLERFQIKYLAAEGGMASVYLAQDHVSGHEIAVKTLYPYYSENRVIRTRFLEEGRIQRVMRHPNVIRVFDVIEEPALAILMEFVDGPTLDDFLAQNGPLTTEQVIDVIIPVMSAVGFAHSRGIIHRDIKPSNILLVDGDLRSPKVLDFGVAKIQGSVKDLTATGTTVGTLHYMSPEQIVGSREIDGRADIYSLGVTMYKLVAGEVPFNAPTEFALMMAQVEAPPLPPSKLRPEISRDLENVILRAMKKKPSERYQTIKDFTSALLDLRMGSDRKQSVSDTISGTISSEIIDLALRADEVALDRTSESGFFVLKDHELEEVELPMDNSTVELEATIKIEDIRAAHDTQSEDSKRSTSELSNSQVLRLTRASRTSAKLGDIPESAVETEPIKPLQARLAMLDRTTEDREDEVSTATTRPSRPSAIISDHDLPPREDPDDETISLDRPASDVMDEGEVLRGGVHVADEQANSRDMTAPKVPEREYREMLERKEAEARRVEYDSAPRVVIGHNPADTNEQTKLQDRGRVMDRLAEMQSAQQAQDSTPGHVGGMSRSSDPFEDGRMHLPLSKRDTDHSRRSRLEIGPTRGPEMEPHQNDTPKLIAVLVFFFVLIIVAIILAAVAFI